MHDLDDPDYARFAWHRFRGLLAWMIAASAGAAALGLIVLGQAVGPLPLHMAIATTLGIFCTILLAAALMGLVFLSSGSGHDDKIEDPFKDLNP